MILRCAALAAIGGLALVQPAAASPSVRSGAPLSCPHARRLDEAALGASLRSLDEQLARLEETLAIHEAARDRAIDRVRAGAEQAIAEARMSPRRVDAIVARAVARAQAEARAAASAERAVEAIRPRLEELKRRLDEQDDDSPAGSAEDDDDAS